MYINIGGGVILEKKKITGIYDLDITSQSYITRAFLNNAEKNGRVINTAEDIPKSYVVCEDKDNMTVYLCQAAAATLYKRYETGKIYTE